MENVIRLVIEFIMVPLLLGVLYQNITNRTKKDGILAYIQGSLLFFCISGILAMPLIKLNLPFAWYRRLLLAVFALLCMGSVVLLIRAGYQKLCVPTGKQLKYLIPAAVIFLCLTAVFFVYEPDVSNDITAETILTTVSTNTMFQYHPLTGKLLEAGIFPSAKLMALPMIYSVLYDGSGMSIHTFLYRLLPICILALNFLIFWKWTALLWENGKDYGKRAGMLAFYGILNLFGDYLFITFSYKLLHETWKGETLLIAVILPFLTLQLMKMQCRKGIQKEQAGMVLLCLIASVFLVPWKLALFLNGALILVFAVIYGMNRAGSKAVRQRNVREHADDN